MHRLLKRLLWVASTLGLGALAYALMRNEGERVLRSVRREPDEPQVRPRSEVRPRPEARSQAVPRPRPVERPETAPSRAVEVEPPQCSAVTKSGERCAREAQPGSQYCWQHG